MVSCIFIDIYNEEYGKCKAIMATTAVLKKDNQQYIRLSSNYILHLLIYCNCDECQSKWSATYR